MTARYHGQFKTSNETMPTDTAASSPTESRVDSPIDAAPTVTPAMRWNDPN
jgi:hypothetical protein